MAVYVDNMKAAYGRMVMCHMTADSREELDAMADQIGVNRRWIQHPGTHKEHYDIALCKRELAIRWGAQEITWRETALRCRAKQSSLTGQAQRPPRPR